MLRVQFKRIFVQGGCFLHNRQTDCLSRTHLRPPLAMSCSAAVLAKRASEIPKAQTASLRKRRFLFPQPHRRRPFLIDVVPTRAAIFMRPTVKVISGREAQEG